MLRHYYVSDDLDDLELVEVELEASGVTTPHIHILSDDEAGLQQHNLHSVESVLKKDVVHSTEIGAIIGIMGFVAVLGIAYIMKWHETGAGWMPFVFLSVVVLGFCTWVGGFIGIQEPNYQFKRFQHVIDEGKHVLFVDVEPDQESVLQGVIGHHPKLRLAGTGESTPSFVVAAQDKFHTFMKVMP